MLNQVREFKVWLINVCRGTYLADSSCNDTNTNLRDKLHTDTCRRTRTLQIIDQLHTHTHMQTYWNGDRGELPAGRQRRRRLAPGTDGARRSSHRPLFVVAPRVTLDITSRGAVASGAQGCPDRSGTPADHCLRWSGNGQGHNPSHVVGPHGRTHGLCVFVPIHVS